MTQNEFEYNPLSWFEDLVTDPASIPWWTPNPYDASGGTFPTTTPLVSERWIIQVWGTLPAPVWTVKPNDTLIWDGTVFSKINWPVATTSESVTANVQAGAIAPQQVIPQGTDITQLTKLLTQSIFYPTYIPPTFGLSANQASGQEIGKTVSLDLHYAFDRGMINGKLVGWIRQPWTFQDYRAWVATNYTIDWTDEGTTPDKVIASYVLLNTQTFSGTATYATGPQPKDSTGANYQTPLAGGSSVQSTTITAIYPWFYWKVSGWSKPTKNQALINSGTKIVWSSTGTITATFASASTDWLWFAIPATSTSKTKWFIDALNNGSIGGGSNLFDTESVVAIDSPTVLRNGINYKIYVSNYTTQVVSPMQLQN